MCEGGTFAGSPFASNQGSGSRLLEKPALPTSSSIAKKPCIARLFCGGGGWIRTIEVSDNRFTVCPLWPLGNSSIFGYVMRWWSWWTDSNPRPADYKSAALPAELHQRIRCDYITIPFGMGKVKTQFALFCRKSKAAAFPAGAAVFFPSG